MSLDTLGRKLEWMARRQSLLAGCGAFAITATEYDVTVTTDGPIGPLVGVLGLTPDERLNNHQPDHDQYWWSGDVAGIQVKVCRVDPAGGGPVTANDSPDEAYVVELFPDQQRSVLALRAAASLLNVRTGIASVSAAKRPDLIDLADWILDGSSPRPPSSVVSMRGMSPADVVEALSRQDRHRPEET